jgi:hypothetical protein
MYRPLIAVDMGREVSGHFRALTFVRLIAAATRHACAAFATAGTSAPRLIRMVLADPSFIAADETLHRGRLFFTHDA